MRRLAALSALLVLLLTGCGNAGDWEKRCTVIFEDSEDVFFYRQVYQVVQGEDLEVTVGVPTGYRITSVNFDRYSTSGKTGYSQSYDYYTLMLHEIRYPVVIRLTVAPVYTTVYHLQETVTVHEESARLYPNTLPYESSIEKEGYLPIGWNTAADGSGTHVGFGSRAIRQEAQLDLYAHYLPCTPEAFFTWQQAKNSVTITGYCGSGDLVIPQRIQGFPVTAIASGAFGDIEADIVAFPPTLVSIAENAFQSLHAQEVYLFDDLSEVSDGSFGDLDILHLHVNAIRAPVYCGSYFDTLSDKIDYLCSVADQPKILLFCGSSARFGYDSPMLEQAFPDYRVVNMGVYAYANMLPQARLLQCYVKQGDILISSPELDAIGTQFCGSTDLDKETFAMMESNYDLFAQLCCREFTRVFDAFRDYQAARGGMEPRSYCDIPSYFDEDGNRQEALTYNRCGDYILYRENNLERKNFGIKRAYYNADYISPQDWDGLNRVYDSFTQLGVQVFFTYSPRSATSISEDSTPQAIAELDRQIRSKLHAAVISSIEDSLMDPLYFYATDNHLSTEGVQIHTRQLIADLRAALEETP